MVRYQDLYLAAVVVNTPTKLANRLNAALDGVASIEGSKKKLTGIIGRCGNTGYLVLYLDDVPVATIDLATMNVLVDFATLDVDIPVGSKLAFVEVSSSGTAVASLTARYEV